MIKLKTLLIKEFVEVPFVGTNVGAVNDELYVHYDDNYEPIRAYVYRTSPLVNFNPDDWEVSNVEELAQWKWKWKPSTNKLFIHVDGNLKSFLWWIEQLGYVELTSND